MINSKKRVGSLFLMLILVLSFSLQTLAATEKPVLTQKIVAESTVNKLFPKLLKLSTGEGLKVEAEKLEPELDNDLKLDLKTDPKTDPETDPKTDPKTAKLGDSGQETPASGPVTYALGDIDTGNYILSNLVPDGTQNGKIGVRLNFDYLNVFDLKYKGDNTSTVFYIKLSKYDSGNTSVTIVGTENFSEMSSEAPIITGINLHNLFGNLENGSYQVTFDYSDPMGTGHVEHIAVTFDSITSEINGGTPIPTNPVTLGGESVYGHPDNKGNNNNIEQTWKITAPAGTTFADGTTTKTYIGTVPAIFFDYDDTSSNKLPAGEYKVSLAGTGTTLDRSGTGAGGTVIPGDPNVAIGNGDYIKGAETTFQVKYPTPTVAIDKIENPESIVVARDGAYSPDSTYTWQVYEWDGTTETAVPGFLGAGAAGVPNSSLDLTKLKGLAVGSYRVKITETDVSNSLIKGEAVGDFTIVGPLVKPALVGAFTDAPASMVLPANPTSGTGTPKFSDSTVTWEIVDKDGNSLTTAITGGTAAELKAALILLPADEYKLKYTETAKYNSLQHSASVPFQIINPLTSSKITGTTTGLGTPALPVNPTSGTGTQNLPTGKSVLTWEILDKDGKSLGTPITSGNTTDLAAAFKTLPEGEYKLQYTETSTYNVEKDVKETPFKIENPLTTAKVDVPTNPTKGTGTQKFPTTDSTIGWEIKDSNNAVVGSGTGLTVPATEFAKLPNGGYTLDFTETSNYNGETDMKSTPFNINVPIDKPLTTTTVTGTKTPTGDVYNPTALTGTQKISSSALTWEIKDKDDNIVEKGQGSDVPKSVIDKLAEGPYTVNFTETALDGQTHTSSDKFSIVKPDPTPTIDKTKDPESITAVPHIPDSKLTWEIKDSTGKVIVTGDGAKVPTSVISSLDPGSYEAVFTETSLVPGLKAESSVAFTTTKKQTPPVTPGGGNTGGGSWNEGGWSRDRPGKTVVDKSPNLSESNTKEIALPRINTSLEEGNLSPNSDDKNTKAATNPQTNDTTSQRLVLNIFFAVLAVALVVLVLNSIIPKKSRKR